MLAIWMLVVAVLLLAAVIFAVAFVWWCWGSSRLDSLTDEEIAARLAPHVAPLVVADLIVMQADEDERIG
jgi:hypothetical protein